MAVWMKFQRRAVAVRAVVGRKMDVWIRYLVRRLGGWMKVRHDLLRGIGKGR